MRRIAKIIIVLLTIFGLAAAGLWYVNRFVLPAKIKGYIVGYLEEKTGYRANIEKMAYLPLTRFYLKNVSLSDAAAKKEIVKLDELSLSFQLWPFLKNRDFTASLNLKNLRYGASSLDGPLYISLKRRDEPANRPFLKNMDGAVKFANLSFSAGAALPAVESITGSLSLKDNGVSLKDTFFKYKNVVYNIEAEADDLDKDESGVSVSLDSGLLKAKGDFLIRNRLIEIKKIDGKLLNTSFNIMGDIKFSSMPVLNLYGEASVDLSDLCKLFPASPYLLDSLKPAGLCGAAVFFQGRPGELRGCEGSVKLKSKKLFLHGLALDNLDLDLRMKDGVINTQRLDVKPYLGLLNGSFKMDLTNPELPYALDFALKDANLAKFSADMNFGKESLTGLVSSKFSLEGFLRSKDSLRGNGWITVSGGYLWEIPLLGGVTDFLGMPQIRSEIFREAVGNFTIGDRRLSTQDITFFGEKVNMNVSGYVDFDGNIDALLETRFTEEIVNRQGASDANKLASLIMSEAGNYLGKIRITGTLKNPRYGLYTKPLEELFKKEIKGLLKDILQ